MVKDELKKLLNQPYKSENWKKITEFVFPNVSYLQKAQDIPFSNDKVETFRQVGNVKLADGKNLALFEVHVAKSVNISRNRVELRKLVEGFIDQDRNHGVLVIYEQGKEDYRFTFTAKSTEFDDEGNFKNIETDAKRYTYILGKNESCKTAANRFWELSTNKDKATIHDVEQAFSVERLNKEFFDKYKKFYEDFVQHITGKRFEKEKGKYIEKTKGNPIPQHETVFGSDDKVARNFVKLLLGRLVFIQFLQKKGWMGVPTNTKKWDNGQQDFLHQLFLSCSNKEKFHSEVLRELFFKAFNTPNRPNDVFELTGTRVPYLNGGLFENELEKTELINFPSSYFEDLFDFFGQYNFTIDENDPLDHEVGIDPEMLGHIFENLLEDNKDKGAFYTPKPIVQYMCQESLIQYLKTYLIEKKLMPTDIELKQRLEDNIQNFVVKKVASEIIDFDEQIGIALRDVKICDPAIGSGAFPMGILNEIYYCIQVLFDASPDVIGDVWGMDSWQADKVKKNIIQHSIYGVDIEKGAVDIARLRFWLSLIVDEKEPYPLPNLDYKIIVGDSLSKIDRDLFSESYFAELEELKPKYFESSNPKEKAELKKRIDELLNQISKGKKQFDFEIYFSDVFHEKNGFDIIIGNPPYINIKNQSKSAKKSLDSNLLYSKGADIYVGFIERSFKLLKESGCVSFIVPNKFFGANYGKKIRNYLKENTSIYLIWDLKDEKVFESAQISTIVFIGINEKNGNKTLIKTKDKIDFIEDLFDQENKIQIESNSEDKLILSKLYSDTIPLKELADIRTGVMGFEYWKMEPIIHNFEGNKKNDCVPIYTNGSFLKYQDNWETNEITLYKSKYTKPVVELNPKFLNNNTINLFKFKPKILVRGVAKAVSGIICDKPSGLLVAVHSIIPQKHKLEVILAILNSNLINWFHLKQFYSIRIPQGSLKYPIEFFDSIPIPKNIRNENQIIETVKKISNRPASETIELRDSLDVIVYHLYDLTYDEVKIIDPTFSLNELNYNKFKLV